MKKRLIPLLLLMVFALTGCDKSIGENIGLDENNDTNSTTDESLDQLTEATTYYNDYFGIAITVPAGYWMYEVSADNMSTQQGLTSDFSSMDVTRYDYDDGSFYEYIGFIDYATLSDDTKTNHIEYFLMVENESTSTDIEAYVDFDNLYWEDDEETGRKYTLDVQEPFTLGELSGIFRTYHVTNDQYTSSYYNDLYTFSLGDGYYATINAIYWDDNVTAQDNIKDHILENYSITPRDAA